MINKSRNLLNKYWLSRGVLFGKLIFEVKPQNYKEWCNFLQSKNNYLVSDDFFKNFGITEDLDKEKDKWIHYLRNSFWTAFISETKAIERFKEKGIDLIRSSLVLDRTFGIDFEYTFNEVKHFVIVKKEIPDQYKLIILKRLAFFNWGGFNLSNSKILVFESKANKLFKFCSESNKLVSID